MSPVPAAPPPEHILQQIWLHQRVRRDALRTLDGRPVVVLHPGFANREAGPDFRRAVLQIGAQRPTTGDVEIDLVPAGWHQHQHHLNPAYLDVRLHVVWEASGPGADPLPTLALAPFLDAPLAELIAWLSGGSPTSPPFLVGACALPFAQLPPSTVHALLHQAALVRLERKAAQMLARARQVGWERVLWEALFAALGYKQNVWPMRRLAELLPLFRPPVSPLASAPADSLRLTACLLGVAGLLPLELRRSRPGANDYLRQLWDTWWRERSGFEEHLLPAGLWRLHGLRPANHPARRLALAAGWLADPEWLKPLEQWLLRDLSPGQLRPTLLACLQVPADPFWSHHWTLRSGALARPHPMLGASRVTDLAMNALLPWFHSRAAAGHQLETRRRVEERYFAWPAGQDNAVLRLARQRFLESHPRACARGAALQQGLLQIVRDYCDRSDARCQGCPLPDLLEDVR